MYIFIQLKITIEQKYLKNLKYLSNKSQGNECGIFYPKKAYRKHTHSVPDIFMHKHTVIEEEYLSEECRTFTSTLMLGLISNSRKNNLL